MCLSSFVHIYRYLHIHIYTCIFAYLKKIAVFKNMYIFHERLKSTLCFFQCTTQVSWHTFCRRCHSIDWYAKMATRSHGWKHIFPSEPLKVCSKLALVVAVQPTPPNISPTQTEKKDSLNFKPLFHWGGRLTSHDFRYFFWGGTLLSMILRVLAAFSVNDFCRIKRDVWFQKIIHSGCTSQQMAWST